MYRKSKYLNIRVFGKIAVMVTPGKVEIKFLFLPT